jgi:hypothetical protein
MRANRNMSKQDIVAAAMQVVAGTLDPLEGCRRIVRQQCELTEEERQDPDFLTIVGIESETDSFPSDEVREHWQGQDLAELDRLKEEYLQRNRRWLVDACRAIALKFSTEARS